MKKFSVFILVFTIVIISVFTGCNSNNFDNDEKINIVSTIFPLYDFSRQITGDKANLKMLIKPAGDTHTYEPTPQDIISIEKSDVFLYIGGESDEWVENIIDNIDTNKTKVIKLIDYVDTLEEIEIEGMQTHEEHSGEDKDEPEIDEHIWTSPVNAIKMVTAISNTICGVDQINSEEYLKNTDNYIKQLNDIDNKFRDIVENSKRKEFIFGDRFPLIYFAKEYGLKYYAAFPGCSSETEPSASTLAFLVDKMKEDNIPCVLKIELSNGNVAQSIASEVDVDVLTFYSCHNLTKDEFDNGESYISMMNKNIETLKKVLN